jgi:hypothetical protein
LGSLQGPLTLPTPRQLSMQPLCHQLETGIQCSLPPGIHVWMPTVVYRPAEDTHEEASSCAKQRGQDYHGQVLHSPMRHLTQTPLYLPYAHQTKNADQNILPLPVQTANQSQILCRLGHEWHKPNTEDLPFPVPPLHNAQGPRARLSSLEALASRVLESGPHCNKLAVAPWEAPN